MASFTDEYAASLEKTLQNAEIAAVVRCLVTPDDVKRDLTGMPFVCVIDSPALGTTRAFHNAYGEGFLAPTAIEVFNKGTKKAILAMRQTNLATVVKADFQYAHELTSGSKGSGSLRCVVADGMSSFPLTASYAFQAVALLDANEVSVISITMVVNDRQLGHAVPCSIGKLVNCVTKFAADRSLDARVVDSRSYSSRGKLARDGMFWSLFLLAPKTLGADRIASIHDSSKHAAKASMAAIRSPLSHRSLKLPDIIRSGFAWQVVSTLFRLDNSKFGIPLSTASLPVDVERELDASVVSDRFMIFDGARVKNLRSEAVGKGDFIVDVCIVSREEILAARRVQPEAIPTKQQWFGTKAFPEHSTCKDGLNARLDYERFELQRSASCVEKTLSGYRSLGESDFSGHYVLVTAIRHSPKIMNFLASNAAAAPAQGLSPSDGVRLHDKGGADAEVDAGARAPSRVSVVLLSDDSSEPSDDEDVIVGYTLDVDAAASEYGQSAGFLKPSADDDARLDGVGASDCRPGSDHRIAGAKRAAEGPLLRPLSDPYLAEAAEGRGMSVGSDDIRTHPSSGLGDTVSDLGAVAGADVASFPGFHVSAEKAVPTLALHRSCCDFHDPGGDHPLRGYTKKRRHDGLPEPWCSDAIYDSMLRRDLVGVKAAIAAGVCTEGNFSHGTTHLITAAAANLFDFVNVLIDAGANVCAMNSWGNTALFHAVLNGNLSMVKVLLNARANVFTVNLNKETPLIIARKRLANATSETAPNRRDVLSALEEHVRKLEEMQAIGISLLGEDVEHEDPSTHYRQIQHREEQLVQRPSPAYVQPVITRRFLTIRSNNISIRGDAIIFSGELIEDASTGFTLEVKKCGDGSWENYSRVKFERSYNSLGNFFLLVRSRDAQTVGMWEVKFCCEADELSAHGVCILSSQIFYVQWIGA